MPPVVGMPAKASLGFVASSLTVSTNRSNALVRAGSSHGMGAARGGCSGGGGADDVASMMLPIL